METTQIQHRKVAGKPLCSCGGKMIPADNWICLREEGLIEIEEIERFIKEMKKRLKNEQTK